MYSIKRTVLVYLDSRGRSPFDMWIDSLKDIRARQKILARIGRLELGNWGDWKSVSLGIKELRVHHGPGYRIYIGEINEIVLLLLIGGDKNSQLRDIVKAQEYFNDYKKNKKAK